MANLMDEKMSAWEAEVNRTRATYGEDADIPRSPYGQMTATAPEAMPARIARLAKEVAEAAHQLDGARTTYDKAQRVKVECQARFVGLSEGLLQAIHEPRGGAPEGVPYQP